MMLGFFQSKPIDDPKLGQLVRRAGWWVTTFDLPRFGATQLRVAGGRNGPDPRSADLALRLPELVVAHETEMATALYDHYLPGREVWQSGEFGELFGNFPDISAADDVWPHVRVERVDVNAQQRDFTIEIACAVAWDEEHTLGIRLDGDRVVEVCGSIL